MFKTNEYFDGKVKSIAFDTAECPATIEYVTATSGRMEIKLPGENRWKVYKEFETFVVPKDVKFNVRVDGDTSCRCYYK